MVSKQNAAQAFTLVEVLLALLLGGGVLVLVIQTLLVNSSNARRLGRVLRERIVAQRALTLIGDEALKAKVISRAAPSGDTKGCGLAGREVRLYLQLPEGDIIYSVESGPSLIWRRSVLMRCGPSYSSTGELRPGTRVSSVLIDAVAGYALSVQEVSPGIVLNLERHMVDEDHYLDRASIAIPEAGLNH